MADNITKDAAEKIVGKLGAVVESGAKHDLAKIYHEGREIAQFGVRRGSKRGTPHTDLPGQLYVGKRDCLRLAQCSPSREGWVEIPRSKGLIADADDI